MDKNGVCFNDNFSDLNCDSVTTGSTIYYRPRGSLARALYDKQQNDEFLNNFDKKQWYQCNLEELPKSICAKFVQLGPDQDTIRFLQQSEEKSDWIITQIWYSIAKAFLGWFMTQTSINGWLQRGSMFVVSLPQFLKLLGENESWRRESILDLGAGDGEVTANLAYVFENVYATEVSHTMRTRLENKGYTILEIDNWYQDKKFDVISCLNLLDRCDTPLQVLSQIKSALKPNGRVLLAIVLPFSAYVESGSADNKPVELLPIVGTTFEQQIKSVIEKVIIPAGFEVISWSRVPYLCEGDLHRSYYWLDDSIFVLKANKSSHND